jgi:uncharacterized protein YjiS (DUF1127 family)
MSVQLRQEAASIGRSPGNAILPGVRKSALSACLNIIGSWIVRSDQRKALRELAGEGRLLSDIGLTRAQALSEAGKPFWRR